MKVRIGHKLNLTTGKEGLVLMMIESGNPVRYQTNFSADDPVAGPIYGQMPDRVAADGGYASTAICRSEGSGRDWKSPSRKRKGLTIDAMTSSQKI